MTLTKHGHHVPGTTIEDEEKSKIPAARCGGREFCLECKRESAAIFNRTPKF